MKRLTAKSQQPEDSWSWTDESVFHLGSEIIIWFGGSGVSISGIVRILRVSEWYRGKDIWALLSISRFIKTSYHLEQDGYAEVHKWLREINNIFSRIVDCHCSHCDITRVLHQLLKYICRYVHLNCFFLAAVNNELQKKQMGIPEQVRSTC